ncbi:hypothetical protein FSB76_02095 [Mucilaginibacter ginsenosidivorax]|uniref:O-antigen ligase-related domain-containing protein n=1 Tax=Mucilaginibacter ginsenosidivorax TaxID=862126 RepID=A0A5B8VUI2_9SPHI|nr:hypothetical protein FSB76_02095 [Mucilaginibacter ginsenosidivorax]
MTSEIKKYNVEFISEYILAAFMVYANGSWLLFEFPTAVKLLMYVLLTAYLLYDAFSKKLISYPNAIVIFLAVFPLLSKVVNISKDPDLVNTFSTLILYLILGFYRKKLLFSILDKYAQIIFFLCIVSVVLGSVFLVNYSLLSVFPVHYNELFADINGYYNLIIYTDRVNNDFRVQSIFWEPGAWVFNEVFALFWYIYIRKETKGILIYLYSIFLTLSTTGFILLIIIATDIFLFSKDKKLKRRLMLVFVSIISIVVFLSLLISVVTDVNVGEILYVQTVDKLFTQDNISAANSANDRLDATLSAFKIATENPIFGIGKQQAENTLFVTSSISELCYQLGFIYLFVYLCFFRVTFKKINFFISIPFLLVLLNGEAYSSYILSSLILIYGAKDSFLDKILHPVSYSSILDDDGGLLT